MKKISKEKEKKIMEMIKKAGSEEYETEWDAEGRIGEQKKKSEMKKGKLSRGQGARFELKVRSDLESKEWIVDKWTNNVEDGKLIKAKRKYNPFMKMLIVGTGFPDFVAFKKIGEESYDVIGVEVKINGTLSKIEKEKCRWYLKNKIFSGIWIAKKYAPKGVPFVKGDVNTEDKKRGQIEYVDFWEKHNKT